jgi:hypothetical protein
MIMTGRFGLLLLLATCGYAHGAPRQLEGFAIKGGHLEVRVGDGTCRTKAYTGS